MSNIMKSISFEQLVEILNKHELWVIGAEGGKRADLSYYDLSSTGLKFTMRILDKAIFKGANLTNCIFHFADVDKADFTGANLTGADFRCANMQDTIFKDAITNDTIFKPLYIPKAQEYEACPQ